MSTSSQSPEYSPANLLALLGGALIVAALVGLVSTTWSTLDTTLRILITSTPTLFLFLIGFSMKSTSKTALFQTITLITALLAFPFSLGVILYETAFDSTLSSQLLMVVFGVTALVSAGLEFGVKLRNVTPFTLGFAVLWLVYSSEVVMTPGYFALAMIGLGVLSALLARPSFVKEAPLWSHFYLSFSQVTFIWAALILPDSIAGYFLVSGSDSGSRIITLVSGLVSSLLLGVVILSVASRWQTQFHETKDTLFAFSRRNAEVIAALSLIAMPTLFGIFHETYRENLGMVLALIPTTGALLLSYRVPLSAWRVTAWTALGVLLFTFLLEALEAVDISLPLILLVVGIILFIVAYLIMHRESRGKVSIPVTLQSWRGLGEPVPDHKATTTVSHTIGGSKTVHFAHEAPSQQNGSLLVLILILLGIFVYLNTL